MVEKIIVSPESIRALGNIVVPKTGADFEEYNCTMEVSEDTVNGEDVTVYVLTPETTTISLVLSSNVSTVTAGGNVILSVTVTEDEVPVSGQSVSFKLGGTEIGTGTTNSSGVATYTYTTTTGGSLNFSADYAGHSSNAVSVVVNKRSTSTSLSLGSASIIVGGSTSASATVTSTGSGVSGLTVTFYDGTTILGTATTNSSGVATYTLSGLSVGSHSITAVVTATDTYDTSTSSASTLTVLDHSYSLAFSAASYVATGGSATLECTLLDNSVPVEGATISVSGSDSSLYTGLTNNDGIASVTVSNISSETTFTATYQGASATCTVTVQSYLFYDDCTSDRSSEYSRITQSGWRTPSITYNSDGYYTVKTATSNSGNNGLYIGDISGLQDCKISMKLNRITTSGNRQIGVALWNTSNNYHIIGRFESTNNSMNSYAQTNTVTVFINVSQTLSNNTWYALEFIKQGNDYTLNCYDDSGTLLKTGSGTNTTFNNVSTLKPFIFLAWDSSKEFRVKDIKVEAL